MTTPPDSSRGRGSVEDMQRSRRTDPTPRPDLSALLVYLAGWLMIAAIAASAAVALL